MKTIHLYLTAFTALFGVACIIAGIVTGKWHLFLFAVIALTLAYAGGNELIEKKR